MTERRIVYAFLNDPSGARSWSLPYAGEIEHVEGDAVEVTLNPKARSSRWIVAVVQGSTVVRFLTDEEFRQLASGFELRDASDKRFL